MACGRPAVGGSAAGESPSGHSPGGAEMTSRERLEIYLAALRRRLRTHIYVQAGAIAAVGALLVTCIAVWLFSRGDFAPSIAISARVTLVVLLGVVAVLLLWLPLRRLSRD